ncbi:hypothetical protein MCHI_003464 [Candidatus Magnetoovum chiemensis]|nr:hypothetical protein MCHI_003464 [Candidatus Magnetoovum chiemensis]
MIKFQNRFEDVPSEVYVLVNEVIKQHFSDLINVKLCIIYDTKPRKSKGKLVLARVQKTNHLIRFLTRDDMSRDEGYDFILFLDKLTFTNVDEKDRIRLIRYQLRYIYVDPESPKDPYKLSAPDIEDFYSEQELNKDDPKWAQRVMEVAFSLYELDKDRAPF